MNNEELPIKDNVLDDIDKIIKWSKSLEPIQIIYKGKPNIYNGFIFPIFNMKEVKEIYFYSTSLLWGHKSIHESFVMTGINEIRNGMHNTDFIKIIMHTDLPTLYQKYGDLLLDVMHLFHVVCDTKKEYEIYYTEEMQPGEYRLFMKIKRKYKRKYEYFQVHFRNKSISAEGALPFKGSISVTELPELFYNSLVHKFNLKIDEIRTMEKKLQDFMRGLDNDNFERV